MDINSFIDHTLLSQITTESDVIKACIEAKEYGFKSLLISSCYVPLAKQLLNNSDVRIGCAIGYPFGSTSTETKIFEAKEAIANGAREIDMVVNIGLLKSRNNIAVLKDLADVKLAIGNIPLKVAIEISELSKNEIIRISEICLDAKVDFIKTSTGFSKSGATLTAIKIIKKTIKDATNIMAAGGICDYENAMRYIDLGVSRLGTSHGVEIVTQQLETTPTIDNRMAI